MFSGQCYFLYGALSSPPYTFGSLQAFPLHIDVLHNSIFLALRRLYSLPNGYGTMDFISILPNFALHSGVLFQILSLFAVILNIEPQLPGSSFGKQQQLKLGLDSASQSYITSLTRLTRLYCHCSFRFCWLICCHDS